jgi:hypothetical protein
MTDIVAAYLACNDEGTIAESIRSIKAYVDRFVVVDAVFPSNPAQATHSSDQTRQIVERICSTTPAKPLTYISSAAKLLQYYARNAYLEQIHPPDWVFVIDSDEVLYGEYHRILDILGKIRSGELRHSVAIPVYTVAVNVEKMAPEVTTDEFTSAPLITTMGYMPRFFAAHPNLRYSRAVGSGLAGSTPVLTFLGRGQPDRLDRFLLPENHVPPGEMFLINHHTRQSFDSYQNDYVWAMAQRTGLTE